MGLVITGGCYFPIRFVCSDEYMFRDQLDGRQAGDKAVQYRLSLHQPLVASDDDEGRGRPDEGETNGRRVAMENP